MISGDVSINKLREAISQERKIINEMISMFSHLKKSPTDHEREMVVGQLESLQESLKKTGQQVIGSAEKISMFKKLMPQTKPTTPTIQPKKLPTKSLQPVPESIHQEKGKSEGKRKIKAIGLEKQTIKRLKVKKEKIKKKKVRKASKYAKISSSIFYNFSMKQLKKGRFRKMHRELVRAGMYFVPANYISMIFFTTIVAFVVSIFLVIFFMFFKFVASPPFFIATEGALGLKLLRVFWIAILLPILTFLFAYYYPSLEKKAKGSKLEQELPFATIHMAAVSQSLVEPSKIFSIIISTKEYPHLEKEFIKLQNEINVYGYDLVTALRNRAFNGPSRKLAELFNGLATTITSGGDLPDFFEKRSQSLLFEHRLSEEKQTKASETFMDIYISLVIAAPMILMLLLIMMRMSGLGVSLSISTITVIMVLSVILANIFFLTFLHLKQPGGR